jgi:hypothetical protein
VAAANDRTTKELPRGTTWSIRSLSAAGVTAGALGGALMALTLALGAIASGNPPWRPLTLIGSALLHPTTTAQAATAALLGTFVHLGVSVFFGVVFAVAVGRRARASLLGRLTAGIAAALAVMLLMTFSLVPRVSPRLFDAIANGWALWVIAHVAYGVGLAFAPLFRQHFDRRARLDRAVEA